MAEKKETELNPAEVIKQWESDPGQGFTKEELEILQERGYVAWNVWEVLESNK